jgi:GNAT superfamily N-acetyltransferase
MPVVRALAERYENLDEWRVRPDYLDHGLTSGRFLVAEDAAGFAGFGIVLARDGVAHLTDLFVDPERKGEGIGSALLAELWDGARERVTFASADERALPLYVRHGMIAVTPLVYLDGTGSSVRSAIRAEAGSVDEITARDARVSGRRRPEEHAFLAAHPATAGYVVGDGGYGWIRTEPGAAYLGPCGGDAAGDPVAVLLALIARAAESAPRVHLPVPGWHPGLRTLLEAGFKVGARDTVLASRLDLVDLARYVPSMDLG